MVGHRFNFSRLVCSKVLTILLLSFMGTYRAVYLPLRGVVDSGRASAFRSSAVACTVTVQLVVRSLMLIAIALMPFTCDTLSLRVLVMQTQGISR